ncbi:hypothetical protein FBU59_004769, partial [Linderina macrospora]
MMACDGNTVCGQSSDNTAVCHDPSKPLEKPQDTPKLESCDHVGDSKCASDGENKYYTCTDKGWQLLTCDGNTICGQTSESAVVCHDPSKPLEKPQDTPKLEPCDHVGDGKCASDGKNKYYTCTDKGWQLLTCDGDTVCGHTSENAVVCHDPSKPIEKPKDTPKLEPCDHVGDSKCASDGKNKYYTCTDKGWQLLTCDGDTVCGQSSNSAVVCHDPNKPLPTDVPEPEIHCDTLNATMCDKNNKSKFYKCLDNKWMHMACEKDNVCAIRNNKVQCMDQASADAPVDYCKTPKATRCAADNKRVFQVCTDGYWQNSTCSDNNYCLLKNDKATCVDKAASEAVQVPCRTENATQCYDGKKNIYQVCIDHYWTNSTCAKDTYCLFRNGKTSCVDKATAEAPVQPCTTANATRCVTEDDSIFQMCVSNYWTNSTCDSGNVCGMKQGRAVCHDPSVPLVDVPDQPCTKNKATQ